VHQQLISPGQSYKKHVTSVRSHEQSLSNNSSFCMWTTAQDVE